MASTNDTLNHGQTLPSSGLSSRTGSGSATGSLTHEFGALTPGEGALVFHRYLLQRILGRGGMGVVWLATDTKLDRPVALKFLPDLVSGDPGAVKELKDETRHGLDLAHPYIVRIYDFLDDEQTAAISMEFVDGESLSELRLGKPGRVFTVDEIRNWLLQVCEALDYAHLQRRLVHRDLKPANLMVDAEGNIKIADFGIARSVSDTISRLSMARPGTGGTLLYMSPQQTMGDKPHPTDDLYSLGATVYELLTGKPPFYTGDVTHQILHKAVPTMKQRRVDLEAKATDEIPSEWEEAVASCLDKSPAGRPQTAGELAQRLAPASPPRIATAKVRIAPKMELPAPEKTPVAVQPVPRRRKPLRTVIGSVLLLAAFALAFCIWWANRRGEWSLDTSPKGAVAYIEGVGTQITPAIFTSLKPGRYEAKIALEGYEPHTVGVEIDSGQALHLPEIQLQRSTGTLLLYSDPDTVQYEVRGRDPGAPDKISGSTPKILRLPVGSYEVLMRLGSETKKAVLQIDRNAEVPKSFKFIPAKASNPIVASSSPKAPNAPVLPSRATLEAPPATVLPAPSSLPVSRPTPAQIPTQPPATEPPGDYWKLDETFASSDYSSYSENGRQYVLYCAQQALGRKGLYDSSFDGREGKATYKAIQAFQSASHLIPNGLLDQPTLEALKLADLPDNADWSAPRRTKTGTKEEPNLLQRGFNNLKHFLRF